MMNSAPTSKRYQKAGPGVLLVSALALTGWLASPGGVAANTAAGTAVNPAPAQTSPQAAVDAAAGASGPAGTLTPQQIYMGMIEAEQRRRALWMPDPAVSQEFAEKWGVQIIGVHLTAGGYWLRFAFRVDDTDKAGMLFDNRYKPYLESEESGVKLAVPTAAKVGALRTTNRQGNIKNGKIYNIMFSNPGSQVKPGQKVAVVAGEFKVEHLTVRGVDDGQMARQGATAESAVQHAAPAKQEK